MTPVNIQMALQAAFAQCEVAGLPLDDRQKQILLQAAIDSLDREADRADGSLDTNPLDDLTPQEREILLEFVNEQTQNNRSWKVQLLNDWLRGETSGAMQFVRDTYGVQWLDRVEAKHLAQYFDASALALRVGDRIEISNSLWEWVQDDGPCSREWFVGTIVSLAQAIDDSASLPQSYTRYTICTVRFENGIEYEIQGMYEWNRYNWRYPS